MLTFVHGADRRAERIHTDRIERLGASLQYGNPLSRSKGARQMMKACLTAAIALLASSGLCRAQDVAAGEVQFKKCAPCHDVGEKAKNRVGPVLNGLEGRKSGTIPNFKYSEANKNSEIVWDEAQFLDYIKDPKTKIPRTIMVFAGIKDEADAKNLWAYLKQFDAEGKKK
jgi:cytochrome c